MISVQYVAKLCTAHLTADGLVPLTVRRIKASLMTPATAVQRIPCDTQDTYGFGNTKTVLQQFYRDTEPVWSSRRD
jgi:hypothetical protein